MNGSLTCVLCNCDITRILHVAAPLGQGKRVCGSCVSILTDRQKKLIDTFVPPGYEDRYSWKATMESGEVVNQYGGDGSRRSVGILDFQKVKRLYFESPIPHYPPIDLRIRLDQGERGIAFFQKTVTGNGLLDCRQVVGIQKPVAGHSVKFFVLCCVDKKILVSSTDDVD